MGSGNGDPASFAGAVADARTAFDIAERMGMPLTLLDIGGGFPGSEHGADLDADEGGVRAAAAAAGGDANPYASHPSFRTIASHVRAALERHFPASSGVTLMGEPGRFFVKSSHTLAVSVVGKRRTVDEAAGASSVAVQQPRMNYYVRCGMGGGVRSCRTSA